MTRILQSLRHSHPDALDFTGADPTSVCALLDLLEERDPGLRAHSEAVARMSVLIAAWLGLPAEHCERLRRAALLHDVGKLAIPDAILRKPGPLESGEFELIQSHPVWSHRIMLAMGWIDESCWVLHHHERPDGRGYPHGLRGDQTPIEPRILHVADAYDALTAERPYRAAMSSDDAFEIVVRSAGTDFDAACVTALAGVTFH